MLQAGHQTRQHLFDSKDLSSGCPACTASSSCIKLSQLPTDLFQRPKTVLMQSKEYGVWLSITRLSLPPVARLSNSAHGNQHIESISISSSTFRSCQYLFYDLSAASKTSTGLTGSFVHLNQKNFFATQNITLINCPNFSSSFFYFCSKLVPPNQHTCT